MKLLLISCLLLASALAQTTEEPAVDDGSSSRGRGGTDDDASADADVPDVPTASPSSSPTKMGRTNKPSQSPEVLAPTATPPTIATAQFTLRGSQNACSDSGLIKVKYPVTGGPFPIVSWAHGSGEHADTYDDYTTAIAEHGMMILLMDGCASGLPYNQIQEQQINAIQGAMRNPQLADKINTDWPVGIAGHSMGGFATVQNSVTTNVKIGAVVANSPAALVPRTYGSPTTSRPTFFTVGTDDLPQLVEGASQSVHDWLDAMTGPKVFAEGQDLGHMDVDPYAALTPYFLGCFLKPSPDNADDCAYVFNGNSFCGTETDSLTLNQCTTDQADYDWTRTENDISAPDVSGTISGKIDDAEAAVNDAKDSAADAASSAQDSAADAASSAADSKDQAQADTAATTDSGSSNDSGESGKNSLVVGVFIGIALTTILLYLCYKGYVHFLLNSVLNVFGKSVPESSKMNVNQPQNYSQIA